MNTQTNTMKDKLQKLQRKRIRKCFSINKTIDKNSEENRVQNNNNKTNNERQLAYVHPTQDALRPMQYTLQSVQANNERQLAEENRKQGTDETRNAGTQIRNGHTYTARKLFFSSSQFTLHHVTNRAPSPNTTNTLRGLRMRSNRFGPGAQYVESFHGAERVRTAHRALQIARGAQRQGKMRGVSKCL